MFWKREPLPPLPRPQQKIPLERDGVSGIVSVDAFEKITGATFIPQLDFEDFSLLSDIIRRHEKLHAQQEVGREQLWLGHYFKEEILRFAFPDVVLRYIDPIMGWGVFAAKNFKKMEFIVEYTGKVRRKKREDRKNAYCFEYNSTMGYKTPYTIDARDQGGISRYINHSFTPNLFSGLASVDHISHVILVANQPIAKGAQLCYDYGEEYWKKRTPPCPL